MILLHFALILLHFVLVLHFAAIVITFCVSITFCGDYYILRRNSGKKTFHDNSRLKSVKCKLWCLRLLSLRDLNFRFGT